MKRLAMVALFVALFAGCTPEQFKAVVDDYARRVQNETVEPSASGEGDCSHLTYTVTAATGQHVFIGIGAQPPFGYTIGDDLPGRRSDNTYTGTIDISGYDSINGYAWTVDLGDPFVRLAEGVVECAG